MYMKSTMQKVLIFVATKALADYTYTELMSTFENEMAVIHSNKSQNARFKAVNDFKDSAIRILIATDIIARGLDVEGVSHVINLDIPDEPLNYIHRIGRTGRAGERGISISLVSTAEINLFDDIQALMGMEVPFLEVPVDLEISAELIDEELPKIHMKNILGKTPALSTGKTAFHEKKNKNKKVNSKVRYTDKMKAKYGKAKTRGQKSKKK